MTVWMVGLVVIPVLTGLVMWGQPQAMRVRILGFVGAGLVLAAAVHTVIYYRAPPGFGYAARAGLEETMPQNPTIQRWQAETLTALALLETNAGMVNGWLAWARASVALERWHDAVYAAQKAYNLADDPVRKRAAALLWALAQNETAATPTTPMVRQLLLEAEIPPSLLEDMDRLRAQVIDVS